MAKHKKMVIYINNIFSKKDLSKNLYLIYYTLYPDFLCLGSPPPTPRQDAEFQCVTVYILSYLVFAGPSRSRNPWPHPEVARDEKQDRVTLQLQIDCSKAGT